jgi:cell shape-determining protein MreC
MIKLRQIKFIFKGDCIMDVITGYISAHPSVLVVCVILIIIILMTFIFKSLIKLVLIMLFVLLAASGYYYFTDPAKMPEKVKESVETMKAGVHELADKSKSFYKDSKELYKKTKEVPGDVNKLIKDSDKETEKEYEK